MMGRPSNADVIRANRRKRTDNLGGGLRLTVTGQLDRENYDYRWIRGDDARLHRKIVADDWEPVTQDGDSVKEDASAGLGTAVSVRGGTKADGSALNMVLCRKHKVLGDDDRAALEARRRKVDDQMRRGALPSNEGAHGPAYYTHTGNRIG